MATLRRKKREGGQEILSFALVLIMLVPLLLGGLVLGLGLVRSIQTNQVCRDLTDMYIHGADYSTYSMQQLAQRLAQGLNLQIGSSFSGNSRTNTGNTGNGIILVSEIMYVGGTTSPSCVAAGAGNCTNANSFVFAQRMEFGNATLKTTGNNSMGDPVTTAISSQGIVLHPVTDSGAKLGPTGQSNMTTLWQSGSNGTTALQDGQVAYVVEAYFLDPYSMGTNFPGAGTYARYFF